MTTMNNEDPADPSVHEPRVLDAAQEARLADHAYAEGRKDEREATLAELAALLPGPYYMDPPDGGSVTVLEQFRRMALDAQRWRAQQEWISKAIACELRCEGGGDEILDGRNPNPPECDPRA